MRLPTVSYFAFAGFGMFWGTWGATLPGLRDGAGLTAPELGIALLCVGIGAVPAMAVTGQAVDRFGVRVTGIPLIALALSGIVLASFARDFVTLAVGMLFVGATSGASDVAANALAGLAERRSGRRVITLAHGVFSSFVVAGSLGTGALIAMSNNLALTYSLSGLLISSAGATVLCFGDGPHPRQPKELSTPDSKQWAVLPFVAVGMVGALGFAIENAHQSWSAIFLTDELHATPLIAALAPATFAAFAAATRFGVGVSTRIPDGVLLIGGAMTAVAGTLLLAAAQNIPLAVIGLALAAVGTSVLFPTLLSRATRDVPDETRGRATAAVGTTAYLGYVLGPAFVGALAGALDLRGAMIGVAALAAVFALLTPLFTRRNRSIDAQTIAPQ